MKGTHTCIGSLRYAHICTYYIEAVEISLNEQPEKACTSVQSTHCSSNRAGVDLRKNGLACSVGSSSSAIMVLWLLRLLSSSRMKHQHQQGQHEELTQCPRSPGQSWRTGSLVQTCVHNSLPPARLSACLLFHTLISPLEHITWDHVEDTFVIVRWITYTHTRLLTSDGLISIHP